MHTWTEQSHEEPDSLFVILDRSWEVIRRKKRRLDWQFEQ